ncbi:hypothetical protein [Haliangium ochraceum]|uniref:Uncharacterized protein n=1 Tax=Haliangium ochraceum (strain DSM 14365 / JCM 11303 / SMP-2) TaxID=502025 RepID=D0LMP2_HALO1|nr:hypothetical protein [Haliangium ochraceum]ACY18729.1 hypothetical protein Hoch_6258 [Haliangium ochraceum DSM 14365]
MATKTRSTLLGFSVLIGVLLLGGGYFASTLLSPDAGDGDEQAAASGADSRQPGATEAKPELKRTMAQLRQRAQEIAEQRDRQARMAPDETYGFPAETVTLAQEIFDEMWAVRGLVHTHEQRADAARRLMASPRALELVYHTATDPELARKLFDEQQAEARYFSILVLEEAAKDGQHDLVKQALSVVRRGLLSEYEPGRGEDFRGLLTAYTSAVVADDLSADTLQTLGYQPDMPKEMKQIYFETVFSVLWKREGIEVAEARFKEIFPEG